MRKQVIILFLMLLVSETLSQQYWQRVPSPTTKWLTKSYFVDSVYGWASGDSGAIIHTSNGGFSWHEQNSGIANYHIDDIFFINSSTGWAIVNDYLYFGTIILKTSNGGAVWTNSRYPDTTIVLNTIYFLNSNTGYLGAYTGGIYKTTNGGINWNECYVDTNYCPVLYRFPKRDISFYNAQTGYACGGQIDIQGLIWKTTNGGSHWFTYCVTPEPLEVIHAINSNKIISAGGDFEYGFITAQSYNTGDSWIYDTTGIFGVGKSIAYRTPSELWVPLTFSQQWGLNLDSGSVNSNWLAIPAPDSTSVYNAVFLSQTNGWAFGSYGAILKYNKDVIGISGYGGNVPLRSVLHQNYPNPFNPSTIISYELAKAEIVRITIYDLTGKVIKQINDGYHSAGFNTYKFTNHNLASGVYIYKVEAGEFSQSKKMVILK